MKFVKRPLTFIFAMLMLTGGTVMTAEAQTRQTIIRRPVSRPIIVRRIYRNPFYRARYWRYYDPFYADLYKSPYERYLEERWYAERELAGNQRELAKHREKYAADGVITAKERKELEDDVRDVQKARARLNRLNRNY
jgi:hypothetical protein